MAGLSDGRFDSAWRACVRHVIAWLDWFIPEPLYSDSDCRRRARLFLISHVVGPFLGFATIAHVYFIDPAPGLPLGIAALALLGFWAFPFLMRGTRRFVPWALLSIQNVAFIVLCVSYFYGGFSSPALQWLLLVPILAFFYFDRDRRLLLLVMAGLIVDLVLFEAISRLCGGFPDRVPLGAMWSLNLISIFGTGAYAMMLALYNARILASHSELEREIKSHRATTLSLHRAKEEAEAASRAKSEFLAIMSHELRTPLNAIIGFSEIFVAQMFGPIGNARYHEYAKDIYSSGTHLLEIINDILDIAKAEAGKLTNAEEVVDVGSVLDAARRIVQPRIDEAGLHLMMKPPRVLPSLRADSRMLKQILLNLLGNACKFTQRGGQITLRATARRGGSFILSVCDTGVGIAPEHLELVLKPFFQVDSSLTRRHEGTGLGLAVVNAMVRRHGGTVRLKSKLGRGTRVYVVFPPDRAIWGLTQPAPDETAATDVPRYSEGVLEGPAATAFG